MEKRDIDKTEFNGEVIVREFQSDTYYAQYYDIRLTSDFYLTEAIHFLEGKKVKITIEVIE